MKFAINRLYTKLSLGLVVILLCVAVTYTGITIFALNHLNQSVLHELNSNLAEDLVKNKRLVKKGRIDKKAMKKIFHEYMTVNPSIEIYLLDRQGYILSYSADPGIVKRKSVNMTPIFHFLNHPEQLVLGDDPRSHDSKKLFSVTPVPNKKQTKGYLYVVLQGQYFSLTYAQQQQHYIQILAFVFLMISLLIGLIIGLVIFHYLTKRLQRLQDKVLTFISSGFQHPEMINNPKHNNGDEVSVLEEHVSLMAETIVNQIADLNRQDRFRREMMASISHDLRTPLAAVRGYIETTLLKQNNLSEAEYKRFLTLAIKQTDRLQTLIDQLFTYTKLQTQNTPIRKESFSILELIYDVVGKFKIQNNSKPLIIEVDKQAIDCQVSADIAMIERVLDNLILNSIQYSSPQCHILFNVQRLKNNKQVIISIKDNGRGIAKAQQKLVFQTFYRADNPHRSGGNAGLGLAIVKKIIDSHRQQISLQSQSGKGAIFTFTLAIS